MTDVEDAKDYLAETYGVSRSKMKTKEDILAIAKEKVLEELKKHRRWMLQKMHWKIQNSKKTFANILTKLYN